jgi:hypothetical protein
MQQLRTPTTLALREQMGDTRKLPTGQSTSAATNNPHHIGARAPSATEHLLTWISSHHELRSYVHLNTYCHPIRLSRVAVVVFMIIFSRPCRSRLFTRGPLNRPSTDDVLSAQRPAVEFLSTRRPLRGQTPHRKLRTSRTAWGQQPGWACARGCPSLQPGVSPRAGHRVPLRPWRRLQGTQSHGGGPLSR